MDKNIKYTKADLVKIYPTKTGSVGFRKELVSLYFFLTGLFFCWIFTLTGWQWILEFINLGYAMHLLTLSATWIEVVALVVLLVFLLIEFYLIVGPLYCSYVFFKEVRAIKAYLRKDQHATT